MTNLFRAFLQRDHDRNRKLARGSPKKQKSSLRSARPIGPPSRPAVSPTRQSQVGLWQSGRRRPRGRTSVTEGLAVPNGSVGKRHPEPRTERGSVRVLGGRQLPGLRLPLSQSLIPVYFSVLRRRTVEVPRISVLRLRSSSAWCVVFRLPDSQGIEATWPRQPRTETSSNPGECSPHRGDASG